MISVLTTPAELAVYDAWVKSHPEGSLWQSLEWKQYQQALGREVRIYVHREGLQIHASALVVIDKTSFGLATWDIPRGPLGRITGSDERIVLFEQIVADARANGGIAITLSLSKTLRVTRYALRASSRHEQPSATRIIDLTPSEADILKQMKPKGRYNIGVAEKNGVIVEESKDIDAFFALAKKTGERDCFGILSRRHYATFLKALPGSFLLIAKDSRSKIQDTNNAASLLGVVWNRTAYYYYGASDYAHRALMAPYALQWKAMTRSKALGCVAYDLLGIAPPEAPKTHPWAGVSGFKEKFGGTVIEYPPEQQLVLRPLMNGLLKLKRKIIG